MKNDDEKHFARVAEARALLHEIERLEKRSLEISARLLALDKGAEPNNIDPITGERYYPRQK